MNPTGVEPVGPGSLLGGRYRLDEFIARGATAEVFRGTDELLGRRVAVKVFDPVITDLNSIERRRIEVEVLASLSDPHLVTIHDAHIADPAMSPAAVAPETSYVVMELVEGPTLAEEIRTGPVEPARVARIGSAVATALETMHRRGLVHRDVKPANILSTVDGAVKLGDFGLARVLHADQRVTSAPLVMGTAAFFSPEQSSGQDIRTPSDIYSLGLVLLEALTGRREYLGSPVESAVARLIRDPVIPPGLPAPWPRLLTAMTATDANARPTAGTVRAALSPALLATAPPRTAPLLLSPTPPDTETAVALEQHGAQAPTTVALGPRSAARSRRTRLVVAAMAAVEAIVLSAVLLISPLSGASPAAPPWPTVPIGTPVPLHPRATPAGHSSSPHPTSRASSRPAPTTTAQPAANPRTTATTADTSIAARPPNREAPETLTSSTEPPSTPPTATQQAGTSNNTGKTKNNKKTKNNEKTHGNGNGAKP